jgi:hypothetical protein
VDFFNSSLNSCFRHNTRPIHGKTRTCSHVAGPSAGENIQIYFSHFFYIVGKEMGRKLVYESLI